jgi:hypothetical protein
MSPQSASAVDEIPKIASAAVSRIGDLWQAGSHRILCGNALEDRDLRKLMHELRARTQVDVTVRRWQAYTKRDAVLMGTRSTFDEVSAATHSTIRRRK